MKKITLLYFLLFCAVGFAQFSKTHYIPPVSGSDNPASSAQSQYLYISTPNVNPVNFKIFNLGGATITGTVSKSTPYIYDIGFGVDTQLHASKSLVNTIMSNKGYIIEAEDLVYVSARLLAGNGNHAGALVSKGLAALGTNFRIGAMNNIDVNAANYSDNHYTFVSVLATENNTLVQFSDIKPGVELVNNAAAGNMPAWITLNAGQSFVMAVEGPNDANRDGLIGTLVNADKPIAVNCGSFAGSNADTNLDLGFDQIVDKERTGTDYIFIKSTGQAITERVLLVADDANTEVFLNDNTTTTPDFTILNAGDYLELDGDDYNANGNLFIHTSNKVFAYQSVGDSSRPDFANQKMFFVPPLSCETPHVIDNIPQINKIGTRTFIGRVTIVTETGSTLDFNIDGNDYSLLALNFIPGVSIVGPTNVVGNTNYETYTITGLSGNIAVFSTSQLYLASYGSDDAATFGGFYSGFTFKPEISFTLLDPTQVNCIPNASLAVNTLSPFDVFQWYFNGAEILGATNSSYNPTQPGYYYVKATIADCGTTLISDEIPISSCPTDRDNDNANDNIDQDHDNDGIANCTESYGDLPISLYNVNPTSSGNISTGNYTNSYTRAITLNGSNLPDSSANGSVLNPGTFYSTLAAGKDHNNVIQIDFTNPISVSMQYMPTTADPAFAIDSNSEFSLKTSADKTITLLNPDNQLLVDTNYDGIYESGVASYSSFEIRFRANSSTPLNVGSGTFSFNVNLATSLTFTHKNLTDLTQTRAGFYLKATCIPNDTDGDGIPDQLDADSDNDSIIDNIESQGATFIAATTTDNNHDGLADVYGSGIIPVDSDTDGVVDYFDLDSDNDGIYDLIESQSNAADANLDGIIDGLPASFGTNGLSDASETAADSGITTYSIPDTDADGLNNYIDLDSDADGCNDVTDVGFPDGNNDGLLGNFAVITDSNGLVTNTQLGLGYTVPTTSDYITSAPIVIDVQPQPLSVCNGYGGTFTIGVSDPAVTYHWEVYHPIQLYWTQISNFPEYYADENTATLQIVATHPIMNGVKFRVRLDKPGNHCGLLSEEAILTIYDLPVINTPVTLIQCDEDSLSDGITDVNLRQQESFISVNSAVETFTYYTNQVGAETKDPLSLINTPTAYNTGNTAVWVRVENANLCFMVAKLDVIVTATNIPATFSRTFRTCDDFRDTNGNDNAANNDRDGLASFDFSSVTADIIAILPSSSTFSIKYYKNAADAAAETDDLGNSLEITNLTDYRNIGYPGTQQIYVRVESDVDNSCFGLGPYITLIVDPLPEIALTGDGLICENIPSAFITLDAGLPTDAILTDYTYEWTKDGNTLVVGTDYLLQVNAAGSYKVKVTSLFGCTRTRTITVLASDIAHIQNIDVNDFTDVNSISVAVLGSGNYVYSLDYPDSFQESSFFNDVIPGIHEVFVKDTKGCGIVGPITIAVLGAPRYFTPNGDGYNDTWNLKGANAMFNANAVIRIFDRYGKLLKQISPAGEGWNGVLNDKPLPADDYWYDIKLEDGRIVKGHFALKR